MNLLHLEYFQEVATNEHVQKAGEKLHVSPSAVSAGIRALERELGVELFDRVGRNMRRNEAGRNFLPYVREAFTALQGGVDAIHTVQGRNQKRISFSVQDGALWTHLLQNFRAAHPDIHIHQLSRDPDRQGKLMDQANLDFIMTDLDLDNRNLEHCDLFRDSIIVAVPKSHPLARRDQKTLSIFDFQDEVFLFRPKSDVFQQVVDQILREIGFQPREVMEMEYMLRYRMFEKGAGIMITTQCAMLREETLSNYAAFLQPKEFRNFSLVKKLYWKKSPPLSPSAVTFRQYLRDYLSDL